MKKILIVEDDEIMAAMYRRMFSFSGYDVVVAPDGEDGLKQIADVDFDLIILDVMMPKLNGFELLDKIKSDEKTKNIPVVMLTNVGLENEIKGALQKGAIKYIIKSDNDPKFVFEQIMEILSK